MGWPFLLRLGQLQYEPVGLSAYGRIKDILAMIIAITREQIFIAFDDEARRLRDSHR